MVPTVFLYIITYAFVIKVPSTLTLVPVNEETEHFITKDYENIQEISLFFNSNAIHFLYYQCKKIVREYK